MTDLLSGLIAHGIVGREDLPVPKIVFLYAATVVLVVSFVALAFLWPRPRLEAPEDRVLFRVPRVVGVLCGLVGVAIFAIVVWAGFAGVQTTQANLAPIFIYVLFWVGIPVLSVLFGDVFRAFNPWRAIGRAAGWTAK
ncbi:MAG: hypothetical protein AVDCRST_MAG54-4109, partial [uncultured Actinomycetospora sp.]